MTQEELEALPISGEFGYRIEERDGKRVRVPVQCGYWGPLWSEADDPAAVLDVHGVRWMVGRGADGVRYRRRLR